MAEFQGKSFIEVQFPVSKVSKESYKERKANLGQTLTGLGKWWGRKPLILVRSALLGLLMPAGIDPEKDRDIFLKILTMDGEGLLLRKYKSIPMKELYFHLTPSERKKYFNDILGNDKVAYLKSVKQNEKKELQRIVFNRLSYDGKLRYCRRPEEVDLIEESTWEQINNHLGTQAGNLQELIQELGKKRFGKVPVVGDCFCGAGSVPFEAARMGCEVYASDLNPVAMLLTWAALNINGASDEKIEKLREFQKKIYRLADKQITEWGIEHNEKGWRALSYIYCTETVCPECGYKVPLAPSWVIGKGTKTIAILRKNPKGYFDILIRSGVSKQEIIDANKTATVQSGSLICPNEVCGKTTPITALRKDRRYEDSTVQYGLRMWEADGIVPKQDDIFQDRLYCIRYEEKYEDYRGNIRSARHYIEPDQKDIQNENETLRLLSEDLDALFAKGYAPKVKIEQGDKTSEPIKTRGWKYWHHMYNPRQLLMNSFLLKLISRNSTTRDERVLGLLSLNRILNFNSKLSRWCPSVGVEKGVDVFSNQALNPLFNYSTLSLRSADSTWFFNLKNSQIERTSNFKVSDARHANAVSDIWITDPPYADAINYHELSEFFLAWDAKLLKEIFPKWYTDSKRALAVQGTGESFNKSMVEIYRNLADHMPDDGMQIVMFTHQDVKVWAELSLILWSAGLQVTAAWNIATETEASGLKQGNYVKGTVLLVLRKQTSDDTAYMDELYPDVEAEVKNQIDSMRDLDDKDDPNFNDADYLLAAYAASLKVLTSYRRLEDIDVAYELSKSRSNKAKSPVEQIINEAVKIAYDYLIPTGIDSFVWKTLRPEERFYIKGLDLEKNGIYQLSAYQELARGFGVREYKTMLSGKKANQARLRTAMELGMGGMNESDNFGGSLLRNILAALHQSIKAENTINGRNWLKNEVINYWGQRTAIIEVLAFFSTLEHIENMPHWRREAGYSRLLSELLKQDGV
ncbi:MAG: DUF1156 domain-containing protein [Nitrospina sp.]|jgi:putative DNA methylase|nr:DUF1156 domain-containing protein [Nitrospina sp.]